MNYGRRLVAMTLLDIVVVLIVVGIALWLINNYIPMDYTIKRILNVVVVVFVLLWLLSAFGLIHLFSNIRVS
jgi:cytochrome b subunit of formate dehydrogenase